MIEILPAILALNDADFHLKMKRVEGIASWVQIDIMDGRFVPDTSILLESIAVFRHNFSLEIHLMTEHPLQFLSACARIGAKRVVFHIESQDNPAEVILQIRRLGMEVGVAINPDTSLEILHPFVDDIQSVQFMGVAPGQQGQVFISSVLEKIQIFHEAHPGIIVALDGGVTQENIASIVHVGARRIIAGSAIVGSPNPKRSLETLHEIARNILR